MMPDSFKGTMSAAEARIIMEAGVREFDRQAQVLSLPVCDGGEGTVDCLTEILGGEKIFCRVRGAFGRDVTGFYGRLDSNTAVVEMAAAAGFSLIERSRLSGGGCKDGGNPSEATTYGVGEIIKKALEDGCRKIILGIGGSCTNDGGAGMAAALHTKFYDQYGNEFIPVGKTLNRIARIDISETEKLLRDVDIEVMCDVENPLYGERGAAYVFAPQKGADEYMVRMLDYNLRCFADCIRTSLGMDISSMPKMGAAGGMGAGAYVFLNAKLRRGIDVILDAVDFEKIAAGSRAVITGEGKFDSQSLEGKAVMGISMRAKRLGIPVIVIAGRAEIKDEGQLLELGISGVYETDKGGFSSWEEVVKNCRKALKSTVLEALSEFSLRQGSDL